MQQYLGAKELGAELTISVVFVPAADSIPVAAASLTLVHMQDGDVMGPFVGTEFAANSFSAVVTPTKGGNWSVRWSSTPPGAVTDDRVYIDA